MDKLTHLSKYLEGELTRAKTKLDRFIIARDRAYFKLAFFSGDRPGDLGQVKVPEILRFQMATGSYSIMSGVKLCGMLTVMSLVFVETLSQSSAL